MYPRWIASSAAGASSSVQRSSNDHTEGSETSWNVMSSRIAELVAGPAAHRPPEVALALGVGLDDRAVGEHHVTATMLSEPIPNRREVSP